MKVAILIFNSVIVFSTVFLLVYLVFLLTHGEKPRSLGVLGQFVFSIIRVVLMVPLLLVSFFLQFIMGIIMNSRYYVSLFDVDLFTHHQLMESERGYDIERLYNRHDRLLEKKARR